MSRKLILKTFLSPGDVCTLTAALESLHANYPGQFVTDVRTSCDALFERNPHITRLAESDAEIVEMHYESINQADERPHLFIRGYTEYLGRKLGLLLEPTTNRPRLYLSADEMRRAPELHPFFAKENAKFWLINAGVKRDFTLKQWPVEYYQEVINHFLGQIQFVQVGDTEHDHWHLDHVIDLLGKTSHRQFIQLSYHAQAGLGPITYLQHLCAAFEKPYVALAGGREPVVWTQYPLQTTLHTLGQLPCCRTRACWKSRVVPLNDGSEQDQSLCHMPVLGMKRPIGKCMAIIKPLDVIRAIEMYYDGGALTL